MFNPSPNIMISIAITFKSIHDWGKLGFEQQRTRAEF
jgi:hypothetical protein